MDDKMDPNQRLQGDSIDEEIRSIWQPAPAADPQLRANLLAAVDREPETLLRLVKPAPAELHARRPDESSRRLAGPARSIAGSRWGVPRGALAAMGAVALLFGARLAIVRSHGHGVPGAAISQQGASGPTGAVDPNELTSEDEQFALGSADDEDSDDAPSVLELAADDESNSE